MRHWLLKCINLSFITMRAPHKAVCFVTLHQQKIVRHQGYSREKNNFAQFLHTTKSSPNRSLSLLVIIIHISAEVWEVPQCHVFPIYSSPTQYNPSRRLPVACNPQSSPFPTIAPLLSWDQMYVPPPQGVASLRAACICAQVHGAKPKGLADHFAFPFVYEWKKQISLWRGLENPLYNLSQ